MVLVVTREIERLKLDDLTCREAVLIIAKMYVRRSARLHDGF